MNENKINIELTQEEAIVFFELLGRINELKEFDQIQDQSEQRVLWDIECLLEKQLSEPFKGEYQEIIRKARNKVRDKE